MRTTVYVTRRQIFERHTIRRVELVLSRVTTMRRATPASSTRASTHPRPPPRRSSPRPTRARASTTTTTTTPPMGVAIKVARTPEDVRASAQTCANAFAYEQRDERATAGSGSGSGSGSRASGSRASNGEAAGDWLRESEFTRRATAMLDARYAAAIARELEQMVSHHAAMREVAKATARDGRTEAGARARAVRSARSVTMLARFASTAQAQAQAQMQAQAQAQAQASSGVDDSAALPTWVGSASLRVCAPEALFPEPFPTTKRVVPYVSNVAVDVRARGAGVASALLVKCERATRMWGYPELYLHVDVGNARTREMYERRGYKACGEDPWWWGLGGVLGARRVLLKKNVSKPPRETPAMDVPTVDASAGAVD